MPDPLLRPKPLPPHPRVLDRIEHALEWIPYLCAVRLEGKPSLSGCLSGLIMGGSIIAIGLIGLLLWSLVRLLFHI